MKWDPMVAQRTIVLTYTSVSYQVSKKLIDYNKFSR